MGERLGQVNPDEFVRALEKLGFVVRRQTGSHLILRHPETKRTVSVPIHAGDIKRGLLFGLLKQSGVDRGEFLSVV